MCGCRACRQAIDFKILYKALPEEFHPVLENIQADLFHTASELDYAEAVMNNKWPSSIAQMGSLGWKRIED